ncbi:MAG: CHAT domain-containing protein, partial [Microcystaceae cyanobacterium]
VSLNAVSHQLVAQENQRQPVDLVNQQPANRAYQGGKYLEAIALWEQLLEKGQGDLTVVHSNLAVAYYQVGQLGAAIRHWEESIRVYRENKDEQSRQLLAKSLADQAQADNALGRFQLAIKSATEALQLARKFPLPEVEAAALSFLGDSYSLAGEFEKAIEAYSESLRLATNLQSSAQVTRALTNLSRAYHKWSEFHVRQAQMAQQEKEMTEAQRLRELSFQEREEALNFAQQAVEAGQSLGGLLAVESLISLQQLDAQRDYSQEALSLLKAEPDSRSKAYALINLAQWQQGEKKVRTLLWATDVAQNLGALQTQSFALGELGEYYEQTGDYSQALQLTQQAQLAAQQVQALESLYQWQAQAGRIYQTQGNVEKTLLNYRGAVNTLEQIRRSTAAANRESQLDWHEEVEPIYRQLIGLLLEQGTPEAIEESLSVKELLQLAELEDFFQDECTQGTKTGSDKELLAQTQTALVHFFIAPQKTYLILQLPDEATRVHQVAVEAERLQQTVEQWRFELEDTGTERYLPLSGQLYDWLIRPLESDLRTAKVHQLVFIADGVLRNVPMAALHDGRQFLVENYP